MNEEFLRHIWESAYEDKVDYETFKEDFVGNEEFMKHTFDKLGYADKGATYEQFKSDLGASTQPVDGVAVQPEEQTTDPTQPDGTEDPGFWRNSWDGVKNWWQNTFIGMSTATGRQQARQAEALEAEEWLINRDLSTLSDDKIEILADSFKKTQDIQKRKGEQKMWLDSDSFLYQGLDAALSSLWGMLLQPGDVAATAATGTATGAVVGGGVPGAIAGLGYGLSAGMIAAGADLEFSAAIMEHAQEYAEKHGLDVTNPKHLRQIFSDQEFSADAITDALIGTGIIVGADVATLGAASKFGLTRSIAKGLRSAGINTKVGQTVAAAGLGSFSGGAGELGKQIVVDGEVNWREVGLEAFAEVGTGSLEVVASQYGYASKARARKTILDAAKDGVSREDFAAGLDEGVKKGIFDQTVRDALLADFDGAVQMLNSIPEDVVSDPITRNETLEALFDSFKVDEQIAALEAKIAETAEPLRPKLQKQLESLQEKKDKLNEYVGKLPDLKISAEDFSTKQKLFQKFANLGLVLKSGRSGITVKGGKAYVNDPITEDEYNILTDIVGQIQGLELDDSAADQVIAPQGTYKIDGEEATREQMLDVLQNNMEAVKAGEIDIEINDDPELFQVLQDATGIVTEEEGEVVVGEEAKEPLKTISTIEAEDLDQRISEVEDRRAKIKDKDSTEYKEATAELTTLKGERGRVEKYSNQTNEELSQELTQTEEEISTLQQKFDEKINTLVEQGASREEAVGIELRERNTGDQTSFETLNRNAELIESELISRQTPEQKALESREDIKRELSEDLGVDVEFNVDNTFEQPTTIGEGVEGVENTLRVQEAVNRLTELGYEPSERVVTQPTVQKPTEARKRTEAYMTRGRANLPAIQETKKETTQKLKSGKYSMLTAENPKSTALSERENAIRNRMAMNWLRRRGYDPIPIMGKFDTNPENSFLVEDLGYDDAVAFSKLFQQNGVATDVGLVYPDGSMNPRKKPGDSFDFETPPTLDNYSVIKTADGDLSISIGYDWTTTSSVDVAKAEVKYDDALRAKRKHDKESNVLFGAVQTELAGYDTERGKDSKGKQWVRSMDDSKPPTLVQSLNQFARSLGRDLKIADFPRQMSLDIRKRLVKMQKDSAKLTKRVQDSADRVAAEKKKVQDKLRREEEYGGLSRAEVERISQLIGEALSEDAIAKATNALQQIDPETRLIIHPNGAAFERATGEMGPGVEAVWDADSKTIHVNGAVANDRVLYHEVAHVVWSKLFANNPDKITEWADSIRSVLESGNEAEQKIAQELKGFIDQYKQEHADAANTTLQQLKAEEFFAELTSILVRNKAQISLPKQKSILKKIKDLLRKVFGNIPMLKDLNEFDDVVTMTNAIAEGIHEGNIAEIIGNIEGNKELEWGRRYSIDPKLRENPENITPLTREELGDVIYNHPKLLRKAVTPANEKYVFEKLDKVIKDHPNFLKDRGEWNKFWQKVPLLKNTTVIPAYAEGLGRMANGGVDGIMGELAVVTDKQRDLATHGLREADKIGKLYAEGKMTPIDTGLYFMWNILSIGMTAYTHEAGVLTALENNVQKWIGRAANGEFKTGKIETRKYKKKNYKTGKNEWVSETDDSAILDYFEWVDSFVTLNKASAGAKANLRAFGKRFLSKAEDIIPSGEFEGMRKLEALHSILEDRTSSTFDIRRKWVNNFNGMSFDNKIFDFVLLTTGRSDQFVIDRIRAEHFWDADNMKKKLGVEPQYSLYEAPKKSGLNGNGLSKLLNGITGLAFNEAASKALSPSIEEAYNRLGVTEFPTVGRFHWETWVAQSGQEVSHESLGAILQAKMGEVDDAGVRSGKFGDWDFNFEFRKYAGIPFRYEFLDDSGTKYVFDEEAYRKVGEEVRNQNSKRNWADGESRKGLNDAKANPYRFINYDKNNKIIKRETQISAKKRGRPLDKAWYHHDGVDTRRYFDYLRKVAVEVQESSPEYIDQTAIDDNAADVIGSESVSDNSFTGKATGKRFSIGRQTNPTRIAELAGLPENIIKNPVSPIKEIDKINISDNLREKLNLSSESQTIDLPINTTEIESVLSELNNKGYDTFIVGGAVRDALTGTAPKDLDIEVHGLSFDELHNTLKKYGKATEIKSSLDGFTGIISFIPEGGTAMPEPYEFSVPRVEKSTGIGKASFDITAGKEVGKSEAFLRRENTINAIGYNPVTKELYNPVNGLNDLNNKIIRQVSSAFSEDPSRVVRAMQFQSRFGLVPTDELYTLMRDMVEKGDLDTVPAELWGQNFNKMFSKGKDFTQVFKFMRKTGIAEKYFPEFLDLATTPQDSRWHPEGNVEEHTKQVMQKAHEIAERDNIQGDDRLVLMYSALLHDIAKPETTKTMPDGSITARGHEAAGVSIAESIMKRLKVKNDVVNRVLPIIQEHLAHATISSIPEMKGKKSAYRKLQNRLQAGKFKGTLQDLMWLMEADMLGRNNKNSQAPESLFEFYWLRDTLGDEKPLPLLQGRDLIKLGIPEGRTIGLYTRKAQQLQDSQMLTTKQDAIEWAKERIKADDIATYVAPETVETPIVQQDSMPENYQPNSIGPRRMGKRYSLNGKPLDHLVVEQIFREFPEMDIRALQQQLQLRGMNAKVEDLQILKNKVLGEQRKSSFFTKPGDISQAVIDELSVKIAKTATTKDALSQQFQRLFTSTSTDAKASADGLVSLLDRLAKTFDLTLSEFIQQRVPFIGETTEDAILHLEDRVIKPLKNILEKNKIALSKAKTKKAKQAILNNIDAVNELLELLDGVTSDPVFQNDSAARAAIINGAAGRALLVGLTAPDTRTAVHEIFHIIEPYLNAEQRSVLKNAYKNAGGEIRDIDNLTYEESRDVSEYAARLWEDYFANGGHIGALKAAEGVSQGELTKLNNLFKSLWNALRSIIVSGYYNDIKVDIDQHPSVKKLFGELLALPADITAAEAELVNTNHKLINVEIEKILVSMGKNAPTPRERLTLDAQIRIANNLGYLSRDLSVELNLSMEILSQSESGRAVETSPEKVVAIGSAWARTKDLINENRRSMSEAKKRGENIEVFLLKEEKLHEDLMLYTQAYTHLGTSSARSQVYRNLMKDIFFSVKEYKDQVRFENKNIDPKDPIFKKYDALVDKYDKLYNRFSELSAELNEARNNDYATEAKKAYDDGIETTSKDKATPGEKNDAESAFKKFFGSGNIQYSDDANTNKYNVLSNYIKMLVATYPNEVGTFDKLVQRVLDDYQRLTAKGRPSADLTKADVIKGILFTQPREISEYQSKMAELKQIANRLDKLNNLSKGFEGQAKVNNKKPKHTDIQLMDEVIKEIVKIENKIKDHPARRDELMTELLKVRDDIQTAFFNDNTIDLVAVDRLRDRVAALNDSVNDRVKNIEAQIKTIEAGNVPDSWMQAKESKTSKEINEELLFLQGELNALRNEFKVEQASMAHLNELYAKHGGKTLLGLNKVNLYYNKDILWGRGVWPSSLWNNARRYILGGDMSYVMLQGGLHLFKTLGTNMTALVGINRQAAAFDRKILYESLRDLSKVMYFGLTGKKEEILYMHREMMTSGRGAYAKAMGLIIAEPFAPQAIQFEEYYRSVGLGELRVEGQGFISNGLRKALGGMKRFDYFSEGGYLMYINQLKLETFNNIIRNNPNLDETTIRRLANRINNEFGRSSRPLGSGIAEMFAAPRYYVSRINLIGDSVKHIGGAISGDIVARRAYHTMINGAIGMILFQVAMEALGWDFDEDPRSKTFLRYRKGDKTVDLTMGMGKWLSILASMAVYWDEGDYGPNLIEQILGERKYLEPKNDYLNAPQKIFMKKAMDYSLHPGFDKLFWEPAALLGVVPATNKIGQPLGTSRTSRIGSWMIGFAPLGLQPIINAVALETIPGARDKVDIEEGFVPALERVSGEMFMTVFSSLGFANVDYDSTMKNVNVQNHLNAIKFDPAKSFTARHIKKYLPALENKGFDKQIIQTYRTEVLNSTGEDILGWLDKGWKPNEAMIKSSIERHAFRIRRIYKDKYNI